MYVILTKRKKPDHHTLFLQDLARGARDLVKNPSLIYTRLKNVAQPTRYSNIEIMKVITRDEHVLVKFVYYTTATSFQFKSFSSLDKGVLTL